MLYTVGGSGSCSAFITRVRRGEHQGAAGPRWKNDRQERESHTVDRRQERGRACEYHIYAVTCPTTYTLHSYRDVAVPGIYINGLLVISFNNFT